jgi:Na+/H+-dicarboxylate symporter
MLWFYFFRPILLGITFFLHPMFISALLIISGYLLIVFALFTGTYALTHLGENNERLRRFYKYFTLEKGIVSGLLISLLGILIFGIISYNWIKNGFSPLNEIKNFLVALTLTILGFLTISSSFMLSILSIKERS